MNSPISTARVLSRHAAVAVVYLLLAASMWGGKNAYAAPGDWSDVSNIANVSGISSTVAGSILDSAIDTSGGRHWLYVILSNDGTSIISRLIHRDDTGHETTLAEETLILSGQYRIGSMIIFAALTSGPNGTLLASFFDTDYTGYGLHTSSCGLKAMSFAAGSWSGISQVTPSNAIDAPRSLYSAVDQVGGKHWLYVTQTVGPPPNYYRLIHRAGSGGGDNTCREN